MNISKYRGMEGLIVVFLVLMGALVGSFLNVCIDRLPKEGSLLHPPSHCSACQKRIAWQDLIPVFSYLRLRGRCRYCGISIPKRLPLVEAGTGIFFVLLYYRFGFTWELPIVCFYSCLFIVLLFTDLEQGLVPNKVVYPGAGMALLISVLWPNPGITKAVIGGVTGFLFLLIPALIYREGMGWGDVKMAGLIGLVNGFPLVLVALFLAVISGGLIAVALLVFRIKKGRKESIPFAPFLSLGAIATLMTGENLLHWYLGLF